MKDSKGLYYYPFPRNQRVRMYVKQMGPDVCFRMWNADDPDMWDAHGWVPYRAVKEASAMYRKSKDGFDPAAAYDLDAAAELIRSAAAFSG